MFNHQEFHRQQKLSDFILGGQDGLVNVLGLVLGVAAASHSSKIILAAGFAAALAESISMAAVVYTSTLAKVAHYESELQRERREVNERPEDEKEETREIYRKFGFSGETLERIIEVVSADKEKWVRLMMSEELKLEEVDRKSALPIATTVGAATVVGSLIPILPFIFLSNIFWSVMLSIFVSALSLFAVGVYKAKTTVGKWYKSGLEMTIIGIVAALAGYGVGLLFG